MFRDKLLNEKWPPTTTFATLRVLAMEENEADEGTLQIGRVLVATLDKRNIEAREQGGRNENCLVT